MEIKPKQSVTQNKLIILYILHNSTIELSESQINTLTSKLDLLNYFDFKECLYDLEQTGAIYAKVTPHETRYKTTKIGSDIVSSLYNEIRASQRDNITNYLEKNKEELLRQSQFLGTVLRLKNDEYRVNLKIYEEYVTIFEISVLVPSEALGYTLIKNWQQNATEIYKDILLKLTYTN